MQFKIEVSDEQIKDVLKTASASIIREIATGYRAEEYIKESIRKQFKRCADEVIAEVLADRSAIFGMTKKLLQDKLARQLNRAIKIDDNTRN